MVLFHRYTCSGRLFIQNILRSISTSITETTNKAKYQNQKFARKPWSVQESEKLIELVKIYGKKWKAIAVHFPDRNAAALNGRFNYIEQRSSGENYYCLDKNKGKLSWSTNEDELLLSLCKKHGLKWTKLASYFKNRNSHGLMQRYYRLKSGKEMPELKLGAWSISDNEKLVELVHHFGKDWVRIAREIKTRTVEQCRARYRYICLKRIQTNKLTIMDRDTKDLGFITNPADSVKCCRSERDSNRCIINDADDVAVNTNKWKHEEVVEMVQLYHELYSMELVQHRLSIKRDLQDMWRQYHEYYDNSNNNKK